MKRRNPYKEINIFSTSAIDLFASGMGVFIILMIVALPFFANTSKNRLKEKVKELQDLVSEIDRQNEANKKYLKDLVKKTEDLKLYTEPVRSIATANLPSEDYILKLRNVTETVEVTQKVIKELSLELQKTRKEQTVTLSKLRQAIKTINDEKKTSFVTAVVKWDTPRHDIDILVTRPNGIVDSFKNNSGTVFSDARTGPGGEVWLLEKPQPGEYSIEAVFHGAYGNLQPAKVELSLMDRTQFQILPKVEISEEGSKSFIGRFKVDEDGKISKYSGADNSANNLKSNSSE